MKSDAFETDTGVPQGDCMSTNLFTFYLAKALAATNMTTMITAAS